MTDDARMLEEAFAQEQNPAEAGPGYNDAEREKLDKLFNEPAVNPPAVNQ